MTLKKLKKQRKENNKINYNSFSLYNNHSVHQPMEIREFWLNFPSLSLSFIQMQRVYKLSQRVV